MRRKPLPCNRKGLVVSQQVGISVVLRDEGYVNEWELLIGSNVVADAYRP